MLSKYVAKFALTIIFILLVAQLIPAVQFNVKLTNVDSSSAEFELLDDNKTTMNYEIAYTARSNGTTTLGYNTDSGGDGKTVTIVLSNKINLETNQMTLLNKQEELLGDDDSAAESLLNSNKARDNGELYTIDDKMKFLGRTYEEIHRFLVRDLEPNREYELAFTIRAKEAYLSSLLTGVFREEKPEDTVEKQFKFNFKTTFDYDSAAALACNNSIPEEGYSSCYMKGTNCTKCGQTCYEVKQTRNELNQKPPSTKENSAGVIKPTLCEACPCDTSRSTGECYLEQTNSDSGYPQIRCKQCKEPYIGHACNDCQNEGIEYYKNEHGECVKCFCNNNAALDVNPNNSKRRKCQAITGICVDCMFNTTGKHCDICMLGFKGDAISRTCVKEILPTQTIRDSSNTNQRNPKQYINLNEKYTYKTLALFSLYIFCVLSLVLLIFLCIKSRYYDHDHMLKAANNSPNVSGADSSSSVAARIHSILASLNQSGRQLRSRVTFYFGSICPTTMRFVRVASNQPHTYSADANAIGSNDDDRLNLAEYQMFDDSLLNMNGGSGGSANDDGAFTYRATFNELDDVQNDSRNPYRSLTIKT